MFIDTLLATGSIILLISSLILVVLHYKKNKSLAQFDTDLINSAILGLSFLATLFPLTYQYYFLYPPCMLCWYQRIFMFPIFIASVHAILYKKFNTLYSLFITYAGIGLIFSIYHWMIQMNITSQGALCTTASNTVACTTVEILEFGFITMPFMAGCVFISVITLSHIAKSRNN